MGLQKRSPRVPWVPTVSGGEQLAYGGVGQQELQGLTDPRRFWPSTLLDF